MKLTIPRPGARAFDHYGLITAGQAQAMRADGFEGCFAYVQCVTAAMLQGLLDAGLWVSFVLEGLAKTTMPTRTLGMQIANAATRALAGLLVPLGPTIWIDSESPDGLGSSADWMAYVTGAASAIAGAGDMPGGYWANGTGMTSAEIYAAPVVRYWKGASRIVDRNGALAEPSCGWSVVQGMPINFPHASGLQIDFSCVWQDYQGRAPAVVTA